MAVNAELLRKMPILTELEEETVARIAEIAQRRQAPAGTVLFRRGEEPECLYGLLEGQVALDSGTGADDHAVIEVVRPFDHFGMAPVLLHRPSLVSARTIDPVDMICIPASSLHALLEAEPSLSLTMLASISHQYRQLVRQVDDLKRRTTAQRLGCYLLTIAAEHGNTAEFSLPFEKRLLAARLGTMPEHLSRAFGQLQTYGVVTHGRRVQLQDPEALKAFARPDEDTA
jgi:CRP/FNR family transcriptional activator FtrB